MFETRAMLVELTIHQWTARKHDRQVTREVDRTHNANNAGRYNKQLVTKDSLQAINYWAGRTRAYHYSATLPWGDQGQRLLPSRKLFQYRKQVIELRDNFNLAVITFVNEYSTLVEASKARLGSMFNQNDYPSATEVRSKFDISFDLLPVPTANDFRVEVANEVQAEAELTIQRRHDAAVKDCYVRIHDVLKRMSSRVTDATLVDARNIVDLLDDLNITENTELEQLSTQIKRELLDGSSSKQLSSRANQIMEAIAWPSA